MPHPSTHAASPTMQLSILEQSKQGDVRAIATLINRQTQVKGITATAALKDNVLLVRLEAKQVPDQQMVQLVRRSVIPLGTTHFQKVRVFGRQLGVKTDAWTEEFTPEASFLTQSVAGLSLEERAQQGDESAIATLINQALNTSTVTAKARVRQGQLQIVLESEDVSDPSALLMVVQQTLESAGVKFSTQIYGRKVGETIPAWSQTLQLKLAPVPAPSVKEQARQGDLEAISTLLNQAIAHKNATTTVSLSDRNLRVMVQSAQVPDQAAIPLLIERTVAGLRSEAIASIDIYGQQTGDEVPAWNQAIALEDRASVELTTPTPLPPSIDSPDLASTIAQLSPSSKSQNSLSRAQIILILIGGILPIPLLGILVLSAFGILGVLISLLIALIPAKIAADKGYDFVFWYFYGLFLFISSIIHAAFLGPVEALPKPDSNIKTLSSKSHPKASAPSINRDLSGANFQNQNLQGADFRYAKLTGANFRRADLTGADFSYANIGGAWFDHADLSQSTFSHAQTRIRGNWIKLVVQVVPSWGWLLIGIIAAVLLVIPYVRSLLLGALVIVIVLVAFAIAIGLQTPALLYVAEAVVIAPLFVSPFLLLLPSNSRIGAFNPFNILALIAVMALSVAMSRGLKDQNWVEFGTWFGALSGWFAIQYLQLVFAQEFATLPDWITAPLRASIGSRQQLIFTTGVLLVACCAIAGRVTARAVSLRVTSFQYANLIRADLSEANLQRANFHYANLTDTNLTNTNLTQAIAPNGQVYKK